MPDTPSTADLEKRKKYADRIRARGQRPVGRSWYRRLGLAIEKLNKKVTYHLLGRYLNARYVNEPISLDSIQSVLFLRPDAIGDMIVTSPLWRILKARKPGLKIGVAGSYRNVDVLRADADISQVFSFDTKDSKQLSKELKRVRAEKYDAVVLCKLDQKARGALLARRCSKDGITVVIAWDKNVPHHKLFTRTAYIPQHLHDRIHMADRLQIMIEQAFDIGKLSDDERHLSMRIDPTVFAATESTVRQLLNQTNTSRLVVLNTQARNEFIEWGFPNSLELAQRLIADDPALLILTVSAPTREDALIEFLRSHQPNERIRYYPTHDLHEMFALVRLANLIVTPDTSVVHMAAAERKPLVALYPNQSDWYPFRTPSIMIIPEKGSPLSSISVDEVYDAVLTISQTDSPIVANEELRIFRQREPQVLKP